MANLLKVKAKCLSNGEWVEGWYSYSEDVGTHNSRGFHFITIDNHNKMRAISPETICRCTGVIDKRKKLIFEFDYYFDEDKIINTIVWNEKEHGWVNEYVSEIIPCGEATDYADFVRGCVKEVGTGHFPYDLLSSFDMNDTEFIGNIHDIQENK